MKNYIKILNFDNLQHNINYIKSKIPQNVKICAVVKSDAYGHGALPLCKFLLDKVDYFAFSSNEEAIKIKRKLTSSRCLVIGPFSLNKINEALKLGIEVSIENISQLAILERKAKRKNIIIPFHIKIDTGLHRLGIDNKKEFQNFLNELDNYKHCKLVGVFSHIGSGEKTTCKRTLKQAENFYYLTNELQKDIIKNFCNSINTFTHPQYLFDMVRIGIAIYGYGNPNLKPILSVKARIVAIKTVNKGEKIGYGNEHKARSNLITATINIGYGQGLPRLWANCGYVLINNQKAPIIANICMDMTIVDITNIPNVKINDFATILGTTKKLNANTIAKICSTIPYEILTNFRNVPLLQNNFNKK